MIRSDFIFEDRPCPTNITTVAATSSPSPKYRVTNWPEYNETLRRRSGITIWFTEDAIKQWHPVKTGARGRPLVYADHARETAQLIRQVFHLPLRQTEGFMNSLARMMTAAISIPDFSRLSNRSIELPRHVLSKALEPDSLVIVDSMGLKVYGKDECTRKSTVLPLVELGVSCIWPLMKTTKSLRVN